MVNPYVVREAKVKKRVRLVAVTDTPVEIVNRLTGEIKSATPYVGKRMYRDISEFVKLYDVEFLLGLCSYELKVLLFVLGQLHFDGSFRFMVDECMSCTGLSRSGSFKGLQGLLSKDAVRKQDRGHYWINPNIAYRGSRDELLEMSPLPSSDINKELYNEEGITDK